MGLSVYLFNKFLLNTHYMLGIWGYNRARDTHDSTFMKIIMEKKTDLQYNERNTLVKKKSGM